jgi:hypothetical protein
MYHIAIRVGTLLHFDRFARRHVDLLGMLKRYIPTSVLHAREAAPPPSGGGDLACLDQARAAQRTDALPELECSAATDDSAEGRWGPDETWLSLP